MTRAAVWFCCLAGVALAQLHQTIELQQRGHEQEAVAILDREIESSRTVRDDARLARALSLASEAAMSLGKYQLASSRATEALALHGKLNDPAARAHDWNTLGLCDMYLGNYSASLEEYRQSLALHRANGDAEGEITLLNNLGNIYYFQGHYLDALRSYETALAKVSAGVGKTWSARRRRITLANLAALYQRLGDNERALDLYRQFRADPNALPPSEQAQLVLNEGVLFRRLGDPVSALKKYNDAESLFSAERNRDAEIRTLQNIGIVRGLDLHDLPGALGAFTDALRLARESGNTVGQVQVQLYRGEILRRMARMDEAGAELQWVARSAQQAGLVEERWKALYALGALAEAKGNTQLCKEYLEGAIRLVESMRAGLQLTVLKNDFLADKRDVYDAMIALSLKATSPSPAEVFRLLEQSRGRTLKDRINPGQPSSSLAAVQAKLSPNTLVVEYWTARDSLAALWFSSSAAGVVKRDLTSGQTEAVKVFIEALSEGSPDWRALSATVGRHLLAGLPIGNEVRHVIVIPDGPLQGLPFEALGVPEGDALAIEKFAVSYLPSAALIARDPRPSRFPRFPWQRQLVAIGDPVAGGESMPTRRRGSEESRRLPHSAEEVHVIAQILPGRSEQHLGADARKIHLEQGLVSVPLLHLSTHATVDMQDPERSRILFASSEPGGPFDYLFLREIYGLDLKGVDLVTISACDTEKGKQLGGEGSQGFGRAFLAAGATTSVASLWRVVDQPTAEFMKQFYFALSRRQAKAEALRSAKLAFLRSGSRLAHPRFWAAFVMSGDGGSPIASVIPWSLFLAGAAALMFLLGFVGWSWCRRVGQERAKR